MHGFTSVIARPKLLLGFLMPYYVSLHSFACPPTFINYKITAIMFGDVIMYH